MASFSNFFTLFGGFTFQITFTCIISIQLYKDGGWYTEPEVAGLLSDG